MGYPATIRFRSNPADKGFNLYKQWGRPEMIHEAFVSWQAYIEKGNARSALKSAEAASGFLIANKDCDELCLSHGFNHEGVEHHYDVWVGGDNPYDRGEVMIAHYQIEGGRKRLPKEPDYIGSLHAFCCDFGILATC